MISFSWRYEEWNETKLLHFINYHRNGYDNRNRRQYRHYSSSVPLQKHDVDELVMTGDDQVVSMMLLPAGTVLVVQEVMGERHRGEREEKRKRKNTLHVRMG
jgi:hypothetical protein